MIIRITFLALLLCAAPAAAEFEGKKSQWNGFDRYDFTVSERRCWVVVPKNAADGRSQEVIAKKRRSRMVVERTAMPQAKSKLLIPLTGPRIWKSRSFPGRSLVRKSRRSRRPI